MNDSDFNDNEQAFPGMEVWQGQDGPVENHFPGMTLRDWFAGQALSGYRAANTNSDSGIAANLAYADADAMLAERVRAEGGDE